MKPKPEFLTRKPTALLVAVLLCLFTVACASDDDINYVERPVDEIYNEAMDELLAGNFSTSAKLFDEVERQHPYSYWATKGQLMAAFAHYKNNAYDEAIIGLDRFIQLHPGNVDVPYAYYLKALSYYEQITDVARDQRNSELALESFEELSRRFPDSSYTADAQPKIDLLYDHLAGKDMTIGRYYQKRGHYLAAINRYRSVIENYETTTHVPEAMHRLVESYLALGMETEARNTAAVMSYNFPNNQWYRDTYTLLKDNRLLKAARTPRAYVKNMNADEMEAAAEAEIDAENGEDGEDKEDGGFFSDTWDWVF